MDEVWVRALVAVLAASCGVATVVVVLVRRYCRHGAEPLATDRSGSEGGRLPGSRPSGTGPVGPNEPPGSGTSPADRCERAVLRAERAVDSVSSRPVRERLCPVVRRMEAELPNVRALAELARGLDAGSACAGSVAGRTREQLEHAAARFAGITDEVLEAVVDLADEPDLDRVRGRVATLREHFPLTCSMSDVLGSSVAA